MSAKIIAVANMKGGVGKTATVVSLAEALAATGYRVLVIDLDAQANASVCLAGDKFLALLMSRNATIEGFLEDHLLGDRKMSFAECVRSNISNVTHRNQQLAISLLPSSPKLRNFEQRIIHDLTHRKMSWTDIIDGLYGVMSKHLATARRTNDFILIDCAPGISVLTEVSIRLADLILVPTIADFLSTYGLQTFCATLASGGVAAKARKLTRRPHVLITRRKQVNIHANTVEALRNEASKSSPHFDLFETEIPEAVAISNALSLIDNFPSFSQKWGPVVTPVLADLVGEIEEVLNVHRT